MRENQSIIRLAILYLLGTFVANLFTSRRRLEVENLFLRHQLNIALRRIPHRLRLRGSDRALLVWMTWLWPGLLGLSHIVQPATILRWHRAGFRAYWRWKSSGRPVDAPSLAPPKATKSQSFGRRLPTPRSREAIIFSREDHLRSAP